MTKQQYDEIMQTIYENGRLLADDDNSQSIEFDFEAGEQGFTKEEIAEAHERYD